MATLDGQNVFGAAVKVTHAPNANAHQIAEFFGVDGVLSSFGGGRGRTFMVEGLFYGETIEACIAAEAVMRSFADGIGHVLVDNLGRPWEPVIFKGDIQNSPQGPRFGSLGLWYWPYKLVLMGLA